MARLGRPLPKSDRTYDSRRAPEVQAIPAWLPPGGPLGRLVTAAASRAEALVDRRRELERACATLDAPPDFRAALQRSDVAVVAELKRRSPSRGALNIDIQTGMRSRAYVAGGAAALSILTEPDEFGGSTDDLADAAAAVRVPCLKKDFHVSPLQMLEARALGASAVLLIARAVDPSALALLAQAARDAGVEPLIEVRDERELDSALEAGASVIGINARDLETLVIDTAVVDRLLPLVPRAVVAIAESGIRSRADVERCASRGADAVLVGSVLSIAHDAAEAVAALTGVERQRRQ